MSSLMSMETGRELHRRASKVNLFWLSFYCIQVIICPHFISWIIDFTFCSVSNNGKLVSNIFHQESNNAEAGQKPHVEGLTEVDIPELDIHQKIVNNDGVETNVKVKRNVS